MKKTNTTILGVLRALFIVVLGICFLMWQVDRPPFDLRKLEQLHVGMSQEQVRNILGNPRSDFGDSWVFSRRLAWPMVKVRFDQKRRLKEWEYDY